MSRWIIVPLQRSLGSHASSWDALNESAFGNNPMLTSLFVESMLRHFGNGTERLCMLQADGQMQAMCVLKPQSSLVWASFLPSQAQIAPTLIPDADLLPSLLRSLSGLVVQLDLLCNDPNVGGVVSGSEPPTRRQNHALTMNLSLDGSLANFWAGRSRKLQSNIKRYFQRIQTDNIPWRMDVINSPSDMSDAVTRYGQLDVAGWTGIEGTALPSAPRQRAFYVELMQSAAQSDQARVFELWFDNTLVASRLAVARGNVLVMLKTTYSESLAQYSPGWLLLRLVIEHAFDAWPGGKIEFYTDANPDQLAWATGKRWIQHTTVFRWPAAEVLITALRVLRGRHALPDEDDQNAPTVEVFHRPDALPPDAQKLFSQAEQRNVELGMAWYRNLVDTVYPKCPGLRFYVLRHGPQVVAVLPLLAERVALGWRLASLSNYYTALYEPALACDLKPGELRVLLGAVRRDFPGTGSFQLSPMNPSSHGYQTLLGALRLEGWFSFEFFAFGNWYLAVTGTWTDYLATRSSTMRNTIKRMTKKFAGDGGTLQLISHAADMPAAISAYERVYANSWKKPEPFAEFAPGLLQTCASQGWLRLGLAWLNGRPIAAQLWIVAYGRAEIYKVAYDEHFKPYSPGTLVTAMLMQHVIDQDRVHEVDYLIGDDPYKNTWMSHRRERWGIVAYNPRSLLGLAGLAREMLGRWAKPWVARIRKWRAVKVV